MTVQEEEIYETEIMETLQLPPKEKKGNPKVRNSIGSSIFGNIEVIPET